jgi:hypothetical protein
LLNAFLSNLPKPLNARGEVVLKKVYDELVLQASQTYHNQGKLSMHLNMDPEAEFGHSDSSSDEVKLFTLEMPSPANGKVDLYWSS